MLEVYEIVRGYIEEWKRDYSCRYIVRTLQPLTNYRLTQETCARIASIFRLEYPEGLLFRESTVRSSHMASYWQRLSVKEQFDSLGCRRTNLAGAGVVLFDDVRNTGNTSDACRRRLRDDAKCGEVIRLFLARTES